MWGYVPVRAEHSRVSFSAFWLVLRVSVNHYILQKKKKFLARRWWRIPLIRQGGSL